MNCFKNLIFLLRNEWKWILPLLNVIAKPLKDENELNVYLCYSVCCLKGIFDKI